MQAVKTFKPAQVHMGRLKKGTDIIRSLEEYCIEHNIRAGWVNVIGALDKAQVSYYDQRKHEYFHRELSGDYEIVSCSGNVSLKDNQPFVHIHVVLSDTAYKTLGGHLWPGTVSVFAAEFVLFELEKTDGIEGDLVRCPDAETGLALW